MKTQILTLTFSNRKERGDQNMTDQYRIAQNYNYCRRKVVHKASILLQLLSIGMMLYKDDDYIRASRVML